MLKNYLKIAIRNLLKHKVYSFINLAGLAIGIACCVLIILYVREELSYDRFHKNAGRIYRVGNEGRFGSEIWTSARTSHPLALALVQEFPEVQSAVRFYRLYKPLVRVGEKKFVEPRFFYADSSVFNIFTFPLIKGDPQTALIQPYSLVLSQEMAEKYFGEVDPLGQTLSVAKLGDFQITGVLKNIPENSHLAFDFLASYETLRAQNDPNLMSWGSIVTSTYILLRDEHNAVQLETKLPALAAKYHDQSEGATQRLFLNSITDLHLRSEINGELGERGSMATLSILIIVAAFILIIACINFMNLATARSLQRGREVGMRKVIGAHRLQLIRQFLSEAILLALGALALALPLVEFLLPAFNQLVGKNLEVEFAANLSTIGALFALGLLVGIFAGSYPAFALSSFKPVAVLKGQTKSRPTGARIRQVLVVAQFAISIVFIVSTMIVGSQLEFFRNKKLGFDKEQILVLPIQDRSVNSRYEAIKHELRQNPNILSVAAASQVPGAGEGNYYYNVEGIADGLTLPTYFIDHDFIPTLGIELAAGRSFSASFPADATGAFLINETAAKQFGWDDALGKTVDWDSGTKKGAVIGVIKDFHNQSLHEPIKPMVLQIFPEPLYVGCFVLRIAPHDIAATLAFIKDKWQAFEPQYPFQYSFLDEDFGRLYLNEERLAQIFRYSSTLAILIACLGLLGLAAFAAEQRTKEIGVRKVLGATVSQIVLLLSRDFAKLVGIAFVVATPVAYVAMSRWLQNFAYRAEIGLGAFLLAGLVALGLACLTVSWQAIKAALANPVEALRYE
ncbi:ABC transporter permease [bacterium]|nr:ABC transporter permease [bacterium]